MGNGQITVESTNNLTLGSVANPFLLPQGIGNGFDDESIFSTYSANTSVQLSSLLGSINIQAGQGQGQVVPGSLYDAYLSASSPDGLSATTFKNEFSANGTPWTLTLDPNPSSNTNQNIDTIFNYAAVMNVGAPIFGATSFSGNIQLEGTLTLAAFAGGLDAALCGGCGRGRV